MRRLLPTQPCLLPTPTQMLRSLLLLVFASGLAFPAAAQPITGLSDWSLYLDPGHSGTDENVGIFGYSEPQKVLRVGLALRELLLTKTDIDTVYISRTSDADQVSLSQRTDEANSLGVAFFLSIHSDAGPPDVNSTLGLYGGWRSNGETVEKTPNGGGRMGDNVLDELTRALRTTTRGNFADRTFYQGFPDNHDNQFPYLSVNRRSSMASLLSEGGFHTNPVQNQRNMNAEWKQLEAQAMFWSILDYHGLERPPAHIATGIISDLESEKPINGATITIGDATYTTDTYESLFNQYSADPDQLRNGFYYLPDLSAGPLAVTVEAEGYETFTGEVSPVDTFFTFFDVQLVSNIPPVVTATTPAEGAEAFRITDPLVFSFSRPMDTESVEAAFSIAPEIEGSFTWEAGNTRLLFDPVSFSPRTSYTVTIAGTAEGFYEDLLDGDGDGTGGDAFTLTFTTGFEDTAPPTLVAASPAPGADGVELRPVITATYSELIDAATLDGLVRLENSDGTPVPGQAIPYDVGEQSVVTFFPDEALEPTTNYRLVIEPGVEDLFLNKQSGQQQFEFTTGENAWVVTEIDDFEGDVDGDWWAPQESGSTNGIITGETAAEADTEIANLLYEGATSFRLDYGWDVSNESWLIRICYQNCASSTTSFDDSYTLQAYVFGDGNANQFRFAVDDAGGTEVSPWFTIDWLGWQLVSWDMDVDGVGLWLDSSNGALDGTLRFESLQLTYTEGSPTTGRYYVDDLRLVKQFSTAGEAAASVPEQFRVHASYPNPFSTRTTVAFDLPVASEVSATVYDVRGAEVARLASERPYPAGTHTLEWDAMGLASGTYLLRVTADGASAVTKMMLVR